MLSQVAKHWEKILNIFMNISVRKEEGFYVYSLIVGEK